MVDDLMVLNPALAGRHQYSNLALAIGASQELLRRPGQTIDTSLVRDALSRVSIPGRFEVEQAAGKHIVFDGAHNQQKFEALLNSVQQRFGDTEFGIVLASGQKEQAEALASQALEKSRQLILTEYHSEALDMYKPAHNFRPFAKQHQVEFERSPKRVVEQIMTSGIDLWVVTGSFYLLKDIRQALTAS